MLKQRVVTALALLAVFLPSLFSHSSALFTALSLVLISAGAWEWTKLNGIGTRPALIVGATFCLICASCWLLGLIALPIPLLWLVSSLIWILGGGISLRIGVHAWVKTPLFFRLISGLAALFVAWIAVNQARAAGVNFLLSVLCLVWTADIAAYFAGRAFGGKIVRRKLAPSISPGKSWEGVAGGVIGVFVLSWGWMTWEKAFNHGVASIFRQFADCGAVFLLISILLLCGMSVLGDLFESLVKRAAGVKDSSGLLPGHGGVLDRVDALLPTLPVAMLLSSLSHRV